MAQLGPVRRPRHAAYGTRNLLGPARGAEQERELHRFRARERQSDLAGAWVRGLLFDPNGLAVDIECLVGISEQIQCDAAVGRPVVHLLGQLGDRPAEVPVAAESVDLLEAPFPRERREVADTTTVRRLRREQGVVDRPFHDVPVAHIAFQPHEAVDPAEEIGRNAGLLDRSRTILVVGEVLPLRRRTGDQQTPAALFEQFLFQPQTLSEVVLPTDEPVQLRVGIQVRQHHVDVVAGL